MIGVSLWSIYLISLALTRVARPVLGSQSKGSRQPYNLAVLSITPPGILRGSSIHEGRLFSRRNVTDSGSCRGFFCLLFFLFGCWLLSSVCLGSRYVYFFFSRARPRLSKTFDFEFPQQFWATTSVENFSRRLLLPWTAPLQFKHVPLKTSVKKKFDKVPLPTSVDKLVTTSVEKFRWKVPLKISVLKFIDNFCQQLLSSLDFSVEFCFFTFSLCTLLDRGHLLSKRFFDVCK